MNFRPCIDIHNGKIKQIVGGSLTDENRKAAENFVSEKGGEYYAGLYKKDGLRGGHIIMLNPAGTEEYEQDRLQAERALKEYPRGLQIGGGITDKNACQFLEAGASHVIVTSFVFQAGLIHYDNLTRITAKTGRDRLVLDLSCRKKGKDYYIVTDRWQKFTEEKLSVGLLMKLSDYCSEFLIHAVDVEGKSAGIDKDLIELLKEWQGCPVTYAGGVGSFKDLELINEISSGMLDVTIGSSLDLFGGPMKYKEVVEWFENTQNKVKKI
ncbi:phosphoribosylformimino-5-aminoimidazole carboxamide ribotide isomerase [Anaerocolumna sp. AGMB13020]|uniref:phosphoribosylformimino-5-aminoimidazole carboxamide ribotide isomerase n=1 Tax=Anaerocolumna sp. AGMB13020 TaxID=3081750 RepID=UPI002954203C|nr:phosphoribosylformimino-5-aminoimidazole carboxamide ribotide isomerase [Anaerocolumna sp. AGMB13020]WOO38492.1 phosphoribosylformimino-5-aminoimidazole carboxamide ribotide isomerase [Anaerocolumna sp. AGMB13020]